MTSRIGARVRALGPRGLCALGIHFLALAIPAQAVTHDVDPSRGEIVVHTDRSGLFGFAGHRHRIEARAFSGNIELDPDTREATAVSLLVPASSLAVADDADSSKVAKIEHEMRTNVLEVDAYSDITFVSTAITSIGSATEGVRELRVTGELTLHGQTRTIDFQAYPGLEDGDVHVVGDVEVKQTDFGIEPVSAGLGTVKVKDEVTIAFDVWAVPEDNPTRRQ